MADFDGEYLGGTTDALSEDDTFGAIDGAYLELANCLGPPASFIPVSQRKIFGNHGGDSIRLTGTFPIGTPLAVFVGPVGGPYLQPVYGGEGNGYAPRSLDGTSLRLVLPPVLFLGDFSFRVVIPPSIELIVQAGSFVERLWYGRVYNARRGFPPWYDAGPRDLGQEDPQ